MRTDPGETHAHRRTQEGGSQVPVVVPSQRRYFSQNRNRFAKLSQNRKIVVNFSSCTDSGEGENPGKGLRCMVGRNGGGRRSVKEENLR